MDEGGLEQDRFHECRHPVASFMIAAGVNAKALGVCLGHSTVTITFDRYGHLMPGDEAEATGLFVGRHRRCGDEQVRTAREDRAKDARTANRAGLSRRFFISSG